MTPPTRRHDRRRTHDERDEHDDRSALHPRRGDAGRAARTTAGGAAEAAERKKHEAIAQRLAESSRRLAELRAQIAEAPRVDKAKAAEAVARGEDVPPASVERLKAEYAEQQRGIGADRRAAPERGRAPGGRPRRALPVADELDAEIAGAVADVRGDLEATRERLLALAALLGEASWTRASGSAKEAASRPSTTAAARRCSRTRSASSEPPARRWSTT